MKRFFIILGSIVISAYLLLCLIVFLFQKNWIFHPVREFRPLPADLVLEDVYFFNKDGIKLRGWFLDNEAAKTVLFFHGNGGNISYGFERLKIFQELQLNALVFDYRGYGQSEGSIEKEADFYADGRSALDFLITQKKISPAKIIIWGASLGGAVAIQLATEDKFFAVIIESTFSSLDDTAAQQFWFLPTKLLLSFHFNSIEKIKNVQSPLLLIHSETDEMISFSQGKQLFERASDPKDFFAIHGAHTSGFIESLDLYLPRVREFLNTK
jgi:hypothetical protein